MYPILGSGESQDQSPRSKRKERRKTLHLGTLSHLTLYGTKLGSLDDLDNRGGSGGRAPDILAIDGVGGSAVSRVGTVLGGSGNSLVSGGRSPGAASSSGGGAAVEDLSSAIASTSAIASATNTSSKRLSRKLIWKTAGSSNSMGEGELILLRLEGRILEEKEREREKEKRRTEQQQQQHTQPSKEDEEQLQLQQHQQQLQMAAVLPAKDSRGGTLKRMMMAKAGGGGSGITTSSGRDDGTAEKGNIGSSGGGVGGGWSGGSGGAEAEAPLERRQLNPLVLESQEDASVSSLQKALSCVHEEDASLLPPLPMERLHRKSLCGWMDQLTRRTNSGSQGPFPSSNEAVEDEEEIEFEDAEIACLFWMQVELYRQACRSEREKTIERQAAVPLSTTTTTTTTTASTLAGSSSPGPRDRRAAGLSSSSDSREANAPPTDDKPKEVLGNAYRRTHPSAPVNKISSLGWPITPSGSGGASLSSTAAQQPILSSHELRLRIFQQHVTEGAPLRVDLKSNVIREITLELEALCTYSPSSSSSFSSSSSAGSLIGPAASSPLSSLSFSPVPSPLPSPTSHSSALASASPDALLPPSHPVHPHAPDLLFREAQRQVYLNLRKESFPSFLQLFFSASLETMDYPQPLPEVVFEEFRREYSKSEAPVSADAPDDHGWHFLEATKGVRCLRKFYPGRDIGCAKAVGVVGASAAQVFRLVMACSETRQEWDELYLSGKVTENLAPNIQLLYYSMRSLCKTVRKRDFVVARAFAVLRGREGADQRGSGARDTFVVISKSVPSAAHPPQKDFVRGEGVVEGWIIKETGNNSSLITRVVSIDFRGKIPPSVGNALNHRLAITAVLNTKAVFDKVREKTKDLMEPERDTYFPFVARVMYPHQYITREEAANEVSSTLGASGGGSGSYGSTISDEGASGSGLGSSSSSTSASSSPSTLSPLAVMSQGKQRRGVKISEDVDEGDGGPRRECSRATPRSATDLPILSVMEGELVTIVKKVPGSKLWEGFHNRRRGLVNIDYIDPILPTLPSPSTSMIMNPGMVSLMELLLESDSRVVFTLLSVVDLAFNQAIPEAIIRIHEVGGTPTVLIKSAITLDLSKSTAVGTLFRGSEIHTSLLSSYAKTVAKKYLTKTLTSLIHNVCQLYDEGKSFEVDPARLKEGEVLSDNADQLVTTTRSFLDKILRTVDECPASLRDICRHLQREVSSKYPGTHYTVLGGLFFLRLLCPAIVSPTERALIKGPVSPGVRRGLVMISKVLQNLANGIEFGCKEAHMAILNPFIIENLSVVHMFFDKLTDETGVNKALKVEERARDKQDTDTDLPQESLNAMHAELCKHLDAIADKFELEDPEAGVPTLERLLSVLTLLGPPSVEVNKPTSALKGHLRRLSFGKGSFIKTFKQERESQKEKEAAVPKNIIVVVPDKNEPIAIPTIEEIMEERSDSVGNEDVDFSPEQRRRAKLKKEKLEKILGVALSPENLSSQVGYVPSTSAPPSARGDKNMLAVSSKDIRERERARSTTAVAPVNATASSAPTTASKRRQSSTERSTRREANLISPRTEASFDQQSHLGTATVPGSHKQKLVHKRLKLQKLLGTHLSSETMMSQIPSTTSDALIDVEQQQQQQQLQRKTSDATDQPPSPSSMRKKWWSSNKKDEGEAGTTTTGAVGGGAETMAVEREVGLQKPLRRPFEESCGNDPPSPRREDGTKHHHRPKPSTPERPSASGATTASGGGNGGGGGLNTFMRKWNASDAAAKERGERRKSFIPWIGNNGHQTTTTTPPSGGSDDETDPSGGGGGEHQQQQGEVAKPQKLRRKEGAFTGFFRRKHDSTPDSASKSDSLAD